jgi:hypothetical protein
MRVSVMMKPLDLAPNAVIEKVVAILHTEVHKSLEENRFTIGPQPS